MSQSSGRSATVFVWLGVVLLVICLLIGGTLYYVWHTFTTVVSSVGDAANGYLSTQSFCSAKIEKGKVEFDMFYGKDVTGLHSFSVSDDQGKTLWTLKGPGQTQLPKLVYGEVPVDPKFTWTQEFPEMGVAPEDIRGKKVMIKLESRYNVAFGPGNQSLVMPLEIPKE